MPNHTKIMLSSGELEKVQDTCFILTKHAIIDKVYWMFEELCTSNKNLVQNDKKLSQIFANSYPKISKGENYLLLPYVMLDYPNVFAKTDILALRTMFWWGNFFSVTLILKGKYKVQFERSIIEHLSALQKTGIYICIHENEWIHHFEPDNYKLLDEKTASLIKEHAFIKLAIKYDVKEWEKMPELLKNINEIFLKLLNN